MIHTISSHSPSTPIHKTKFSKTEDAVLTELVSMFGEEDWKQIASHMINRTVRQCRERWKLYLTPQVSNGPWTPQEEAFLRAKVQEFGRQWKKIAQFFPGRTDINIKNHYMTLLRASSPFKPSSEPIPAITQPPEIQRPPLCVVPMEQSHNPFSNLRFEQETLEWKFQIEDPREWSSEFAQMKSEYDAWFTSESF
jgi:hypothetical protein